MTDIAIRNMSSALGDSELSRALPAFQTQISRDYKSVYGGDAKLQLFNKGAAPPASFWQINIFDDAASAGYLGYHDVTANGRPLSNVYAKTTMAYGGLWTVTFSHELIEMLGDPWINLSVIDPGLKRAWWFELCDACEADELGYKIDGIQVSDFVLPSYFERDVQLASGHKRSFNGHLTKPFEIAPGGYMGFYDFEKGDWDQVQADRSPAHGGVGSRSVRRKVPEHQRARSVAK